MLLFSSMISCQAFLCPHLEDIEGGCNSNKESRDSLTILAVLCKIVSDKEEKETICLVVVSGKESSQAEARAMSAYWTEVPAVLMARCGKRAPRQS